MAEWLEVNVLPISPRRRESLLGDVAGPLVHWEAAPHLAGWFFFWESDPIGMAHLRLRLWWKHGRARAGTSIAANWLDKCEEAELLWRWYPGAGGVPGDDYDGEAGYYGSAMWEHVWPIWMAGSELALALAAQELDGNLKISRRDHAERICHLAMNQLGMSYFGEARLYADIAAGYAAIAAKAGDRRMSPRTARMLERAYRTVTKRALAAYPKRGA